MKNLKTFDEFINEAGPYETAFNTRMLKNINFILPSWDGFDKQFGGKPFHLSFNNKLNRKDVEKALSNMSKKEAAVKDMNWEWTEDEFYDHILNLTDLNYSGLTYAFKALDDIYGKYGSGMGWM